MRMIKLPNEVALPKCVLKAFSESANDKLCVVYREADGNLFSKELNNTECDLKLIHSIITQNGFGDSGGEFAILNEKEIVYKSIGSDFKLEVDSEGYMHINNHEFVVHPHDYGFVGGPTKEDVDFTYTRGMKLGYWYYDFRFGPNGFIS